MRIKFLLPVCKPDKSSYAGLSRGLGILGAMAAKAGHSVSYASFWNTEQLDLRDQDFIFISIYSQQVRLAKQAMQMCDTQGISCVIGGLHPTFAPDDFNDSPYYLLVRGEGAVFMEQFLQEPEKACSLPGVFRKGELITADYTPLDDIEKLPYPARYGDLPERVRNIMGYELITARGCLYRCTYCCAPGLSGIYPEYYRRRNVNQVLSEIESQSSGFPLIGFHDDHFMFDPVWVDEFIDKYPARIKKPFWINTRVEAVKPGILSRLKKTGLCRMHMGVESGNYSVRRDVLARNITDDQIIQAFDLARSFGIRTLAFNMLGLPSDTEDDIEKLIQLNKRIRPDWIHHTLFHPFPGTRLYAQCCEKGLSYPVNNSYYSFDKLPDLPGISQTKLRYYLENFVSLVKK